MVVSFFIFHTELKDLGDAENLVLFQKFYLIRKFLLQLVQNVHTELKEKYIIKVNNRGRL